MHREGKKERKFRGIKVRNTAHQVATVISNASPDLRIESLTYEPYVEEEEDQNRFIVTKIHQNTNKDQMDSQQNQDGHAASQPQAVDPQSYYYNYTQHQPEPPSYYNHHYANSHRNPAHREIPQQPSSTLPPGVSSQPQNAEQGGGGVAPSEVHLQGQQSGWSSGGRDQTAMLPGGMNPVVAAAAVVLAQLTGTMGAGGFPEQLWNPGVGGGSAPLVGGPGMVSGPGSVSLPGQSHLGPRPMRPPVGRGRFSGTSRGIFRKHFSGRGSSFRGRGYSRGRGSSRSLGVNGESSASPEKPSDTEQPESSVKEAVADHLDEEAKSVVLPQTTAPTESNMKTTTHQSPQAAFRCELCKIECTGSEILEQHNNGKRHKKNLQKVEQLRIANEQVAEMNGAQTLVGGSDTDVTLKPGNLQLTEENKQPISETVTDETKSALERHSDDAGQPDKSTEPRDNAHMTEHQMNLSSNPRPGMKRKMRYGRGGERMKQEPRKPKVVIPLICDLCNVKCDTQEVFSRHLSGKKHISKLKRFEGHQAAYGSAGLQALYPPNPFTQIMLNQGSQQGLHLQHSTGPPSGGYVPPETSHSTPATVFAVPSINQNTN